MYTLVDPQTVWPHVVPMPQPVLPTNQIYMTPVQAPPTYLVGGTPQVVPIPGQMPPMVYNFQPSCSWYHQPYHQPYVPTALPAPSIRPSSDDVFVEDTPPLPADVISFPRHETHRKRRQRIAGATDDDMSLDSNSSQEKRARKRFNSGTNSSDVSAQSSPQSDAGFSGMSGQSVTPPRNDNSLESLNQSPLFGPGSSKEVSELNFDQSFMNVFTTSLYSALNKDPPEPSEQAGCDDVPLKTSSPLPIENYRDINIPQFATEANGNVITKQPLHADSRSPTDFGTDPRNFGDLDIQGYGGTRRQQFLFSLEEERERQRKLVLPKHAPKMNCKFCKNNGESSDVYTKHRLHFKEKTVCPLLRLYVCRLCNSTGDFAHTIRHCPFNSRFDKIAWKATFL